MRESDLLKHVYAFNRALPDHVAIPPGDDMGALALGDQTVLITVDQVADGVHVQLGNTPLKLVARKAITRNLSDVAAMAARPLGAVVAAALPRRFTEAQAKELFDSMRATAEAYQCPLIGGDISMWDHPLLLTVTVFAEPAGIGPILRSGAQPGDAVFVSGQLGGAWQKDGGGAHLHFEPRINLARKIAEHAGDALHSMIDLSDGLASDLSHICEQSHAAAEIHLADLPARLPGRDGPQHALFDGEDYELCFTIAPDAADNLPTEIDGVTLTKVGHMLGEADRPVESRLWLRLPDGTRQPLTKTGWEHHA
ncbi:thiamine-phosphate kinase [Planctomycetales bacterium ZRK34]|nr:thiamine-phosphate kinase [Planctomycetales bacterium ZRK34]